MWVLDGLTIYKEYPKVKLGGNMSNTNKSNKYYRLVNTNWTGQEAFRGKVLKKGTVVVVSLEELENVGLKRRLDLFFVELTAKEVRVHKKTVVGTENITSEPIKIIEK